MTKTKNKQTTNILKMWRRIMHSKLLELWPFTTILIEDMRATMGNYIPFAMGLNQSDSKGVENLDGKQYR